MQNVSFHDIIAGIVIVIVVLTMALLALLGEEIPTGLQEIGSVAIGWLFRGFIPPLAQSVTDSVKSTLSGNHTEGT